MCSARCVVSGFNFDRTARSVRTHGSSTVVNVSFDSQSPSIFSGSIARTTVFLTYPFLCSEKKTTKIKAIESVTTTHSRRATPAAASSDESIDNCELGAEGPGEEMDTTNASIEDVVMVGPEGDAVTDNLATRYANLDSPADRYVCFPSPLFTNV